MRVLVTAPDLARIGGVASYLAILRPHLAPEAEYITAGRRSDSERGFAAGFHLLRDYAAFAWRLATRRYDLVHVNAAFNSNALLRDAVFVLLAKLARRRVLVFLHGWEYSRDRAFWTALFRLFYCRADAIVVLASETRRRLREIGYSGPILQEPTAAEMPEDGPQRPSARPWRVLFLARLDKAKGLYEAIEACSTLRQRREDVELLIAGRGPEERNAREYVRERAIRGVRFIGYVSGAAKAELFASADAYLLPTYAEGLPVSVLEAMAHGLPVVTRTVGGIADFFQDGRMGFATDSLDPGVFADLLERLLADPAMAARMRAFNREYSGNWFAPARVAERMKIIYERVAGGAARRELPDGVWCA